MERLTTALRFGADAVYLGGPKLQLRSGNVGFTLQNIREAAGIVHAAGKRMYVTVNAFADNREVDEVGEYAGMLKDAGVDAVICADLGIISAIRHSVPDLPVHVSTQANCLNYGAAMIYYDLGVKRIVLGREMSLDSIRELRRRVPKDLELEAFVHGAMCMAYSGRCMISAYLTGRSGNKGACTQSCRWNYALQEEKRPGEYFPIEEDERGTTILSSFDMCCIDFLDQLIDAGIYSFKLEGRMKSPFYVATVTNAYRKRIDALKNSRADDENLNLLMRELNSASHRPYASGFYFGEMKRHKPDDGIYRQDTTFVGIVRELLPENRILVEIRNRISEGETVEILSPNSLGLSFTASNMRDSEGNNVTVSDRPSELYSMYCDRKIEPGDLLRIRR